MEIKSIIDSSIDDLEHIGTAIYRPDKKRSQQHVGIVYKDGSGNVRLLHLAWHYILSDDAFSDDYLWLESPLDEINKIHLATVCALVKDSNAEGIPYGIGLDDTGFNEQGKFESTNPYAGLTCATFVIQLYQSQALPIIDTTKWKHRKADKRWQGQILQVVEKTLKKMGESASYIHDYLRYQKGLIAKGCARYKPEEVAVAATLETPPHGAEQVKKPAAQLLNAVVEYANR
ncbi:MAG: hypothetical protein OQL08_07975 [Gammaproteobacteria bacterium]|nr:hypothetical protein [Gammaproteobacteria bacterium]